MATQSRFRPNFLNPKHWWVWFADGFLRTASCLSISSQMTLGKWLGRLSMALLSQSRLRIAKRNLELCFPEASEAERRDLLRSNFEELGRSLFDTANAWYWTDEVFREKVEIRGLGHIKRAREQGHGAILFGVHTMALEITAQLARLIPLNVIYRPHGNPLIEYLIVKGRSVADRLRLIPKSEFRQAVKVLKLGGVLWYADDQSPNIRKDVMFVPFFAMEHVAVSGAASTLAKLGKARLYPYFVERKRSGNYLIEISAPLEGFPSNSLEADVRRLGGITEELISRNTEQYLWVHRRFKRQIDPMVDSYYS